MLLQELEWQDSIELLREIDTTMPKNHESIWRK